MFSNSNDAYTPDVEIVATNTGGGKVTKLPFGDEDVKAEEYNSPKRWRDQVAETATLLGITGSTRNKKFLIGGLGGAALLALAWSVPSMKESHVNKNSAAVSKPASAKSSKAPFAKVTKAKAPKAKASGSDSPSLSLGPSFAPSESDGPTFEPSLSPSASGGPTVGPSLTPSPSASGGPTWGPSLTPSDEPSSSPDPLSLYDFVGNGFCGDKPTSQSDIDLFPYVGFYRSAASPSACASKCTECLSVDGAVSGGSFRGFELDTRFGACYCLVDVGASYNSPGAGCAGFYSDDDGDLEGTGEILGVVYFADAVCYKSKLQE
eukprot:scaffold9903_cov84-Skeletonema_dohrnii-CCMP3373.AAC.1